MIRLLAIMSVVVVILVSSKGESMSGAPQDPVLELHARQRTSAEGDGADGGAVVEKAIVWQPRQTALIVVDMWDDHWCKGAARRVDELAPAMNRVIRKAREQGVFVIHCPSTCVDYYKDTPQRKRALAAPFAKTKVPLTQTVRWGTKWCYPDREREGDLPIDDSDMGCDCEQPCTIREAWTRQNKKIDIKEPDAISDDGQEVINLLQERGIDQVLIMGVHLNMCVLGRSFAIRELVHAGKEVILVRDMTDTMYNHRMRPKVNHFAGTDLVVAHVEAHWCPTITSPDLVGGSPFRFQEDRRP